MNPEDSWRTLASSGRNLTAALPAAPVPAAIRAEAQRRNRKRNQRVGGVALLMGITLSLLPRLQAPSLEQRASRASTWLMAQQHDDGSWSAGLSASQFPSHQVGVTSLALLSLLEQDTSSADREQSITRAITWLIDRQNPDGSFASPGPDRLTVHGMATRGLALARENDILPEAHHPAVDRAERFLARTQSPEGGWGYDVPADGYAYQPAPPITSASVWPIRALALSPDLKRAYDRSLDWIATQRSPDGGFRYRTQQASPGATLMSTLCLHEAGRTVSPPGPNAPLDDLYLGYFHAAQSASTAYRDGLAEKQNDDGSWPLDDRWSAPGGPVYTTAMALLTLASD